MPYLTEESKSNWLILLSTNVLNNNVSTYLYDVLQCLIVYLNENDLKLIDIENRSCWHYLLININNEVKLNIFKLFLPYIKKEYLKKLDALNKSCWHHFFYNINNSYQVELVKILLSLNLIDKTDLNVYDLSNMACWDNLFNNINNEYRVEVIKLLLNLINNEDILMIQPFNHSNLSNLFNNSNKYVDEIKKIFIQKNFI